LTVKDKLIFYGDKGKEVAEKIGSSYNVTTYHFPHDKIKWKEGRVWFQRGNFRSEIT